MKDLKNRILLSISSFVLVVSAGEAFLRHMYPGLRQPFILLKTMESERGKFCVYDPFLGWAGKPSAEDDFTHSDARHHVRQNRYGFRGPEYDLARGSKKRIVVLGDSFVWGFGVEDKDIFTRIIENGSKTPVEIVNLGVSGYGTDQEYLLWKELGNRFKPDEVWLAAVPYNDLWENITNVAYSYPKPTITFMGAGGYKIHNQPVPRLYPGDNGSAAPDFILDTIGKLHPAARLASHSAIVSGLLTALARNKYLRDTFEKHRMIVPRDWKTLLINIYQEPQANALYWERFFNLVELLRHDVVGSGAKFRLLTIPSIIEVYPELQERIEQMYPAYHMDFKIPDRLIREYCLRQKISLIDPLPDLEEAGRRDPFLYFPLNNHWTPAAHAIAARRIILESDL